MWMTKIQLPNQIVSGVLGRWCRKSSLSQAVISSLSHESFCNNKVFGDVTDKETKVLLQVQMLFCNMGFSSFKT